jgi:hypothetical protein
MHKPVVLLLVLILVASSFMLIKPAGAQSITKRSVPKFTLEFTYSQYGFKTVVVNITNQAFASTINGTTYQLYYNIRQKEHTEDKWTERTWSFNGPGSLVPQTNNSQYTIESIPASAYPNTTQIDFQIQAMLGGNFTRHPASGSPFIPDYREFGIPVNSQSDWSSIQTITLTQITPAETPTPTITPTQTPIAGLFGFGWEQTAILLLAVLVAASWVAIVVLWRKRSAK